MEACSAVCCYFTFYLEPLCNQNFAVTLSFHIANDVMDSFNIVSPKSYFKVFGKMILSE